MGTGTILVAIGYAAARLIFDYTAPAGFTTIVVLELISISVNAMFLGVIGEYLAKIHQNIKQRPITRIQHALNLD